MTFRRSLPLGVPARLACAAALGIGLAALASPALSADAPGKGPDPLIRSFVFNPGKSWLLTSTNLEPILVALEAGEQVRGVLGTRVTLDGTAAVASAADGNHWWYVAQRGGAGVAAQPAPAPEGEEGRTVSDDGRPPRGGNRPERPGFEIADEISFQPTGYMDPVLVRVMTNAPDGRPRQHVFVLATRRGPGVGHPDPDMYAMVRISYPRVPTPEESAAARAAQQQRAAQVQSQRLAARLAQEASAPQVNDRYAAADGRQSPGACASIGPRPGMRDITDDGATTTFFVPSGRPAPRLYADMLNGEKRVVDASPATVAGGVRYMLPSTYRRLYLSLEGQVCGVENRGFGAGPQQPGGGTGTVSPYVARVPRVAPGTGVNSP